MLGGTEATLDGAVDAMDGIDDMEELPGLFSAG